MSQLLDFYHGEGVDSEGRTLTEIWAWPDSRWEEVHDFIQWLFPLKEASRFNPDAPLLGEHHIAAFLSEESLQRNLRKSFERLLRFLGLEETTDGEIIEASNFAARAGDVWQAPNHNWLRISRVLRSLSILGLSAEAQRLYAWLTEQYRRQRFPIDAETFRYWTSAVGN